MADACDARDAQKRAALAPCKDIQMQVHSRENEEGTIA